MPGSVLFTVDIEAPHHAIAEPHQWTFLDDGRVVPLTHLLLQMLRDAHVQGRCYVLGDVAYHYPQLVRDIRGAGHSVGSHGMWHRHHERMGDLSDRMARHLIGGSIDGYRSPYWDTTPRPNWACGFFFRALPTWWVVREVCRTGVMALHPHDLDVSPRLVDGRCHPLLGIRRRVGTATAKDKLWRILRSVTWRSPE